MIAYCTTLMMLPPEQFIFLYRFCNALDGQRSFRCWLVKKNKLPGIRNDDITIQNFRVREKRLDPQNNVGRPPETETAKQN